MAVKRAPSLGSDDKILDKFIPTQYVTDSELSVRLSSYTSGGTVNQTQLDAKLNRTGDTIGGDLILPATGSATPALAAVTKDYVDTGLAAPRAVGSYQPGETFEIHRTTGTPDPDRPAFQAGVYVHWVDDNTGLSAPANGINGDSWFPLGAAAPPAGATVIYTADASSGITNGATMNSTTAPKFNGFTVAGSNTQTGVVPDPTLGGNSYQIYQAASGAATYVSATSGTIGIGAAITDWALEVKFMYTALPRPTGGARMFRIFSDDTFAGTSASSTIVVFPTGRIQVWGSSTTALDSLSVYTISINTKYRIRVEGNSATNSLTAILDVDGTAAPLWSATTTPAAGNEVGAFSAFRWGFDTAGTTAGSSTLRGKIQIGTGPGQIAPTF
jgi:hypothetical protein